MRRLSLIFLLILFNQTAFSQDSDFEWIKTFDGFSSGDDQAVDMMIDGGNIYVTGHSYHDSAGSASYDIVTIKYNTNGDILWASRFDNGSNLDDYAVAIFRHFEFFYIIGYSAQINDVSNPDYDVTILRLNQDDGSIISQYQYDGGLQLNDVPSTAKTVGIYIDSIDYLIEVLISGTSQNISGTNDIFSVKIRGADEIVTEYKYSDPEGNNILLNGSATKYFPGDDFDLYLFGSVEGIASKSIIVKFDSLGNYVYDKNIPDYTTIDDLRTNYSDTIYITSSYRSGDLIGNKVAILDDTCNILWSKNIEINSIHEHSSLIKSKIGTTYRNSIFNVRGPLLVGYSPVNDNVNWYLDLPSPFVFEEFVANDEMTVRLRDYSSYYRWSAAHPENMTNVAGLLRDNAENLYLLGSAIDSVSLSNDYMLIKYNFQLFCCRGFYFGYRGDADRSGYIDIDDVVFLVDYCFGFPPGADPVCYTEADVDASGRLDIDDILSLIFYSWGFPAGPPPSQCP